MAITRPMSSEASQTVPEGPSHGESRSFLYDLVVTTIGTLVTTAAQVLFMRVVAEGLGPEQFGAHALARRAVATLLPLLTLGTSLALPRFLAVKKLRTEHDVVVLAGLALGVLPALALAVAGLGLRTRFTTLLFRSLSYEPLLLAMLGLAVSQSLFTVLYAVYRGKGEMTPANGWLVVTTGVGPLVTAWFYASWGRADVIVALSAAWMALSTIPLVEWALRALPSARTEPAFRGAVRQLLAYGLPRVPAGFAAAALFGVGPLLAPHFGSMVTAGHLVAGQSVLTVTESLVFAFGLVALPRFARLADEGRHDTIRDAVNDAFALVYHLGLFLSLQGLIWAEEIVLLLLGSQYKPAVPILRVMLFTVPPYLGYVMLRSIVDAVEDRAINTWNLTISVLVSVVAAVALASLGLGGLGLALGQAVGIFVLGGTTLLFLHGRYPLRWGELRLGTTFGLNIAALLGGLLIRLWLTSAYAGVALFVAIGCAEVVLATLYLAALLQVRIGWLLRLRQRVCGQ